MSDKSWEDPGREKHSIEETQLPGTRNEPSRVHVEALLDLKAL